MTSRKRVFFVSDRTGITVEALGSSLLSQFGEMDFLRLTLPFIDTVDKAREAVAQVDEAHRDSGQRPLVFSSIVDDAVRTEINKADGLVLEQHRVHPIGRLDGEAVRRVLEFHIARTRDPCGEGQCIKLNRGVRVR